MVNFTALKNLYNNQMNLLLANDGLTTLCTLNFGVTQKNECPNCVFDFGLQKSANQYKNGGPIPFDLGRICPYCHGIGYLSTITSEDIYLAIIWDYNKWINPPVDIANPNGFIQTICSKDYLWKIRQAKSLIVNYHKDLSNPVFELYKEPEPAGLGDNNYLVCFWTKIHTSNPNVILDQQEQCISNTTSKQVGDFEEQCISSTTNKQVGDFEEQCISSTTSHSVENKSQNCATSGINISLESYSNNCLSQEFNINHSRKNI